MIRVEWPRMKKTKKEIATLVWGAIADVIDHENDIIESGVNESQTIDGFGFDSLDRVELLIHLEEDFDIEIPDVDAGYWNTISDVVAYVDTKLNP